MYAFRKPFTAGTFDGIYLAGVGYKTVLVTSQVFGYTVSKFIGIKYVSELRASQRAVGILVLIAVAECALLLFAIVPSTLQLCDVVSQWPSARDGLWLSASIP